MKRSRTQRLNLIKDIKLPSQKEMDRIREEEYQTRKKEEKREERDSHKSFVRSGVKAGLSVKAVLWIMRNFERSGGFDPNMRVGGRISSR